MEIERNVRFSDYFFKPVNGFFTAFIMYVGVMSGQFAFFGGGRNLGPQARWSICLLAVLSGFFADAAIEKLREIKQAIFGKEVTLTRVDDDSGNSNIEELTTLSGKEVGLQIVDGR